MSAAALLMLQMNPQICPCCFDRAGTALADGGFGTSSGPCPSGCMPFRVSYPLCPLMSYDGYTCRPNSPYFDSILTGATLSYTPVCLKSWKPTEATPRTECVYWSPLLSNADCNCIGQWAQYCIEDEAGYRGRSWVVEFWCRDVDAGTVSNFNAVIQDWQCLCDGEAHGFLPGAGARFEGNLSIGGCCCDDCGCDCTCTPPATLYADFSSSCSGMSAAAVPFVQSGSVWEGDTGSLPSSITTATLSCHDGTWYLALLFLPADCVETDDPTTGCTCDPFEATFVITLDSLCCPPSGGTITVTFTE